VTSDDKAAPVAEAWAKVIRWCRRHAPEQARNLQPGATAESLAAAQAVTGSWPPDLVAMVSVADGVNRSVVLIPRLFVPLGVGDIVESWRMLTGMGAGHYSSEELVRVGSDPAGTRSFAYLPAWIPFASDFGGNHLFVDRRSGPRSGCISEWDRDEGSLRQPRWPNLAALVDQVATSLGTKRWRGVDGDDLIPTVEDGRLRWHESEEWETLSWNPTAEDVRPGSDDLPTKVMLLGASGHSDDSIASRLGLSVERVAELREEWRRTH
jgi:cell wall assembly regulator SMI1